MGHKPRVVMKNINAKSSITIPDGVTVEVKSRFVKVTGPRGVLSKSFKHMSIDIFKTDDKTIKVEKRIGQAKELSAIKTTCSHIQNMIIGVTKGFKYRMKMVYAHFPTNVQITDGGKQCDIVNFIGQKVKFHVNALEGNSIDNVSRTCALINQKCAIRNKDIRKFLDGIYVSHKGNIIED